MAKFIALQSGHQNTSSNCVTALRSSTGAPGEAEFTVRVRDAVAPLLTSRGFMVQLVDANYNCKGESKDFDLFLAIHYDADVYGTGGGFAGVPDADLDDVNGESKRIRDVINTTYFPDVGIDFVPSRLNVNVTRYYMWQHLTSKTPCVLLECGVGQNAHDKVLLNDTNRIAQGIAKSICKAFGVAYDQTPPPPVVDKDKIITDLKVQITSLTKQLADTNKAKSDLQLKLNTLKQDLVTITNSI